MACRKDGKGRVLRKGEGYRKGDGRYSYVYIDPLGKEELFKSMTASAKIMYAVLMEKQQKSVEMGWIDEKDHAFIMINPAEIGAELNWSKSDVVTATDELEKFGLAQIADKAEKDENTKLYLKRFV